MDGGRDALDAMAPYTDGGDGADGYAATFPWGGVSLPWQVFDGSVPDVPFATAPGRTYFCDATNGNDTYDGSSFAHGAGNVGPKKTVNSILSTLRPGDTLLLGGGIYREYLSFGSASGSAAAPITIGSYGRGTGAPILDGGLKPNGVNGWTRYSAQGQTTVWQVAMHSFPQITAKQPVLGIYVNNGSQESALREVIHGQVSGYGGPAGALPPNQTQANVTDRSNNWYYEPSTATLYADFGGSLASGDPNAADVSVLFNSHASGNAQQVINLNAPNGYFHFVGLTIRAASWGGVYTESQGNSFDHCDFKFNGGAAALFGSAQNSVLYSRAWMNVLDNWPRFNNGYTGGGWPSALSWSGHGGGLSLGNVVYMNGGEGVDFSGTMSTNNATPDLVTNNVVRHNVIYDNFSVNLYVVSIQGVTAEQNFVFQHPLDPSQTFDHLLEDPGYGGDLFRRLVPINLGLGDEPGSSFDGKAYLSNITVVNNVFAGGKRGFLDWDDGTIDKGHGLRNCTIANNTFVLANQALTGFPGYAFGTGALVNDNSIVLNNLMTTTSATDDSFVQVLAAGAGSGITLDYSLYSGPGRWSSIGTNEAFAAWKVAYTQWDQHSLAAAALLADETEFSQPTAQRPVYDWRKAAPSSGSPAYGSGTDLSNHFTTDFTGATRTRGAYDLGAIARH